MPREQALLELYPPKRWRQNQRACITIQWCGKGGSDTSFSPEEGDVRDKKHYNSIDTDYGSTRKFKRNEILALVSNSETKDYRKMVLPADLSAKTARNCHKWDMDGRHRPYRPGTASRARRKRHPPEQPQNTGTNVNERS